MLSTEPLQEGKLVRMTIFLPGQSVPLLIDQAIVRWIDRGQVGLEYVALPLEQLDRLCALLLTAERERSLPSEDVGSGTTPFESSAGPGSIAIAGWLPFTHIQNVPKNPSWLRLRREEAP